MESGTHSDLLEVWGLPPHDVFAVGNDGTILEYDGVTWHGMDSPTSNDLTDVWGWTGDDVFAVTGIGQTLHYDGDTWSVRTAPLLSPLTSLWGVSASEVYAAGDHRDLIRYNGSEWVVAAGPGGDKFSDIWGVGSSFIVVAEPKTFGGGVGLGPEGSIHLYDGNDWRVWADSLYVRPVSIWGASPGEVYAVGTEFIFTGRPPFIEIGSVLHFDGREWTRTDVAIDRRLRAIWGTSSGDVWSVGDGGYIVRMLR
jgi:hypothetical protein